MRLREAIEQCLAVSGRVIYLKDGPEWLGYVVVRNAAQKDALLAIAGTAANRTGVSAMEPIYHHSEERIWRVERPGLEKMNLGFFAICEESAPQYSMVDLSKSFFSDLVGVHQVYLVPMLRTWERGDRNILVMNGAHPHQVFFRYIQADGKKGADA